MKEKRNIQHSISTISWHKYCKPSKLLKKIVLNIKYELFLDSLIKYFANVLYIRNALSEILSFNHTFDLNECSFKYLLPQLQLLRINSYQINNTWPSNLARIYSKDQQYWIYIPFLTRLFILSCHALVNNAPIKLVWFFLHDIMLD